MKIDNTPLEQILPIIEAIDRKVKEIPSDQQAALQVVEMFLSVMGAYQAWTNELQKEVADLSIRLKEQGAIIDQLSN